MNQNLDQMPGASSAAIQQHYDVGNEFYRLWLDDNLIYSAALWDERDEDDDLAAAQLRKLEYHARQARANGAGRVLDIGCGWGAMLRHLINRGGVGKAVGLTLSEAQAAWIRSLGLPQIEVRVESWAEHAPPQPYDAIISIGAFEHFARWGMTRQEKIAGYRSFFARCREWLRPGGWLSLQAIAYGQVADPETIRALPVSRFLGTVIFPESDIPVISEVTEAMEGLFEVVRLRNDREHYARTSRIWLGNLRAHRQQAIDVVGEKMVAQYERYLSIWAQSFEAGTQALLRWTLRRIDRPGVGAAAGSERL
jgi:cyclopropane-fatty-acyl-phospholipid synthase